MPALDVERQALAADNRKLAFAAANAYVARGGWTLEKERDRFVSAALEGLVRAAGSYDPDRGYAFSTYAWKPMQTAMHAEYRRLMRERRARPLPQRYEAADRPAPRRHQPVEPEIESAILLSSLTPAQLELVLFRYAGAGMTLKAMAEEMEESVPVLRQRLHNAIGRMRRLAGHCARMSRRLQ